MNYQYYNHDSGSQDQEISAVARIMKKFNCDMRTAEVYLAYKEDGYSTHQAKVFAGLADPEY